LLLGIQYYMENMSKVDIAPRCTFISCQHLEHCYSLQNQYKYPRLKW
jgi:hypothetical protein